MEGQVVHRVSGIIHRCEVSTTQQYDDGMWHQLTALYSRGECSIIVDNEIVTVSNSELRIPSQDGNDYIGGAPLFNGR